VPSGIWIDEQGKIIRPAETAAPKTQTLKIGGKLIETEGDAYVAALRDWVDKGSKSEFVLSDAEYKLRVKERSPAEREAEASFKLGVALHQKGQNDLAQKWFLKAETLNPDSWNYHRQDWSFGSEAGKKWMEKFQKTTTDYYPKLDLKKNN